MLGNISTIGPLLSQRFSVASAKAQPSRDFFGGGGAKVYICKSHCAPYTTLIILCPVSSKEIYSVTKLLPDIKDVYLIFSAQCHVP